MDAAHVGIRGVVVSKPAQRILRFEFEAFSAPY